MREQESPLSCIALAALFAVGNTLMRYPWKNTESSVLFFFLLSVLTSLFITLLGYALMRRLYRKRLSGKAKRCLAVFTAILLVGYAWLCACETCRDYLSYALEMILPDGSRLILAAILVLSVISLASLGARGLRSFSFLCFLLVASAVLALFAIGIPYFQAENLSLEFPTHFDAIKDLPSSFWDDVLLPPVVLSAYFALAIPQKRKGALVLGMLIGYGLLLLCVLQALFCFGADYTAELSYPYSFSVRIPSVGPYFFRPEGLSYPTDLLSCLLRSAVCLATIKRLFGRFYPRFSRWLLPVCALLLFGILILR